jgi:hypothetical protein
MDQDHNPLLLEDVIAENPRPSPKTSVLKSRPPRKMKLDRGRGRPAHGRSKVVGAVVVEAAVGPGGADVAEASLSSSWRSAGESKKLRIGRQMPAACQTKVARARATPTASMRNGVSVPDLPGRVERDAGQRTTGFRLIA